MIKLDIHALCDQGPTRDNNEDMVSVGGILLRNDKLDIPVELDDDGVFYLLVSDGMGGHEQGERASELLLEHLNECFRQQVFTPENIEEELRRQVKLLNDRLNALAVSEQQLRPMGCTLTGVVWFNNHVYLLNAGDSRTYLFRDPYLRQLTVDQTERGVTGDQNASKLLLNCIGGGAYGKLVVEDITENLLDGDVLLVCSDGLSDMVNDAAIEAALGGAKNPMRLLYEMACEKGGYDNISVIMAKMTLPDVASGSHEVAGGE